MKRLAVTALFVLFAGWTLLHCPSPTEVAEMTPFYLTADFACQAASLPGGALTLVAEGLTSLLCVAWTGALLVIALWGGLAWTLRRLYRMPPHWEWLCWVVALLCCLNFTQQGYMLYVAKVPATGLSVTLGVGLAACLAWSYRRLDGKPWWRTAWTIVTATVGYWLLSSYALMAMCLALVHEVCSVIKDRQFRSRCPLATLLAVAALAAPRLLYACGLVRQDVALLYRLGLPDWRGGEELTLWLPLLGCAGVLLLMEILQVWGFTPAPRKRRASVALWCVVLGLCGWLVWVRSARDGNLRRITAMREATERSDWEGVLSLAKDCEETPTRLQVAYARLALARLERGGDEMFNLSDGDAPYRSPREHQYLRLIGGRQLYYNFGKVNYAYRWAMEDLVEYGARPDYLKCMTKCAILNHEPELARKYLALLRRCPAGRGFARRWEKCVENEDTHPEREAEMREIERLMRYGNVLDGDGGLIEKYLLMSFATMEGGTREMSDLSLQACLILKDIDGFWPRLLRMAPFYVQEGRMPTHYQEAALLLNSLENRNIAGLPIEERTRERFQQLVEAAEANSRMGDEYNMKQLKPAFGGTYWYYYFFVKGLKTN